MTDLVKHSEGISAENLTMALRATRHPATNEAETQNSVQDLTIMDVLGVKDDQSCGIIDPSMGVQAKLRDEGRIIALAKAVLKEDKT